MKSMFLLLLAFFLCNLFSMVMATDQVFIATNETKPTGLSGWGKNVFLNVFDEDTINYPHAIFTIDSSRLPATLVIDLGVTMLANTLELSKFSINCQALVQVQVQALVQTGPQVE